MGREVGGGSGWGTHVNPWLIHVNIWQNPLQYCKVISLQLIKINEKKKNHLQCHPQKTLVLHNARSRSQVSVSDWKNVGHMPSLSFKGVRKSCSLTLPWEMPFMLGKVLKKETVTKVHHREEPDDRVSFLVMGVPFFPLSINTLTSLYYSLASSLEHLGIVEKLFLDLKGCRTDLNHSKLTLLRPLE